ncbi:MAG: hypothetical protein KAJ12_06875 [Bacteroidetes bacterium]|nr:hypothetical protein [Bacteroidota bacterium]
MRHPQRRLHSSCTYRRRHSVPKVTSRRSLSPPALTFFCRHTAGRTCRTQRMVFHLPLGVITGFFGMNFDRLPGLHSDYGVVFAGGGHASCRGCHVVGVQKEQVHLTRGPNHAHAFRKGFP